MRKKQYAEGQREKLDLRKFSPITKTCVEETCGKQFEVSVGEQAYYFSRGLIPRKRCQDCIDRRKATLNSIDRPDVGHVEE